jgi:hypothetical protein
VFIFTAALFFLKKNNNFLIFFYCFDVLISKINFKNKKTYFNIFSSDKYFKKYLLFYDLHHQNFS